MMNSKNFSIEVQVFWRNGTEENTWRDKVEVECSERTYFSEMVYFLDKVKKCIAKVKKFYAKYEAAAIYHVSFSEFTYDHEARKIVKFNNWESKHNDDINGEGIYLTPCAENEDENRDMFIGYANPLKDLIYTLH